VDPQQNLAQSRPRRRQIDNFQHLGAAKAAKLNGFHADTRCRIGDGDQVPLFSETELPTLLFATHREVSVAGPIKRLPTLPIERALKVISGRRKGIILYYLFGQPRRLSELQRLLPDMAQKVLIQQLRELEEHGLVARRVFAEIPPRVEYSATALGRTLEPLLFALCDWGRRHAAELNQLNQTVDCIVRPREARSLQTI
jgi:DNA-binding HxlR family transcriptional regulator